MSEIAVETDAFVAELDAALEAHADWSRRILRCAVLHSTPGEDALDPMAHSLCRFGAWFSANRARFEALDAASAQRLETVHQTLHDAIRALCTRLSQGQPGRACDLDAFENAQAELLKGLADCRARILSPTVGNDPLTGLPLHDRAAHDFILCQTEARRNHSLLYVVRIDVDHFQSVNDTYGLQAGDQVLRHIAHTLQQGVRGGEPLYRDGGEEFLWLLKCKSPEEARKSARRILASIGTTPVPVGDEILRLTITLGLVQAGETEDWSSAIRRADQALHQGKQDGCNRYVIADAP